MKKPTIIFMSALMALGMAACKKKKVAPEEEEITSAQPLLVNKNWVLTAMKVTISGQEHDFFKSLDDCEKDDIYRFENSGAFIVDEATLKCSPPGDQKGKWTLSADAKVITTIVDTDTTVFNLNEVTETTLKVSGDGDFLGNPAKYTATYTKK